MASKEKKKITSLSAALLRGVSFLLSCSEYQWLFLCNASTGIFTLTSLSYIIHFDEGMNCL